ncbi:UAP56-interacting export factor 1 [Hibiscus trionum]|uniref:UAP56-interacting export factor 1 n=2 Tax=Hibiscus trionum TaxID=183268 RepID=A0A9W7MCC1_HIBTR|nr:UAP56-interacting export factor 1 [Hibiscus trionum]
MAAKPLTSEAIALTEKKMDMTLEDIIKMSKNTSNKGKQQQQRRIPNKSQRPMSNAAKDKAFKVQQYMDSRASLRQGVLAQRRSNFQGNRFPFAAEAARRAAVAPFRNRAFNSRRVANVNKPRIGAPPVQRRAGNGGFAAKPQQKPLQQQQLQQQERQGKTVTKQKPKTLDSLFANMKEERMRVFSHQNNNVQHNGGGWQRMPRGRGRFGN